MGFERQLPTEEELATLPRWARTMLAARCVRRLLVLLDSEWPQRPDEFDAAILRAIETAEHAASIGKLLPEAQLQVITRDAWAAAQAARKAKAFQAVSIAQAAWATAKDPTAGNVLFAATEALQACRPHDSSALASAIEADYKRFHELAAKNHWNDVTPVSADDAGALWPLGRPPSWLGAPEAPETRADTIPLADGSADIRIEEQPTSFAMPGQTASSKEIRTSATGSKARSLQEPDESFVIAPPPDGSELYRLSGSESVSDAPQTAEPVRPRSQHAKPSRPRPRPAERGDVAPQPIVDVPEELPRSRSRRKRSGSRSRRAKSSWIRDVIGWVFVGGIVGALLGAPVSLLSGGEIFTSPEAWDPRNVVEAVRTLNPGDPVSWQLKLPALASPLAMTIVGAVAAILLGMFTRMLRPRRS